MIGLTDPQLKIIMTAANAVPVERRSAFLQRVAAMLLYRRPFDDSDVADCCGLAKFGLLQQKTDAA